jgi:adenosylcobinamide-phosphate synthase
VAWTSLAAHVRRVAEPLARDDLAAARLSVAEIVGRNVSALDRAGIARAAIESLAENFSDAVAAPVFWYLVLGLPGLCAFKAASTLDSMIGHRSARYRQFGWASARLDDAANLVPARMSAFVIAAAAACDGGAGGALRAAWRDAPKHRSPNAGWPEAAMAGALGLALGGPRHYGVERVDGAWMGAGRRDAGANDIARALVLARRALFVLGLCLIAIAAIT